MNHDKPFEMGFNAYLDGMNEDDCPFGFDKYYSRSEWMEGFAEAEKESEE